MILKTRPRPIYVIGFLGLSAICLSIVLVAQNRSPVKSVLLNGSEQTVQLGARNVGERATRSVILFNSSWISDKEIVSITPSCGCLKVTPQSFLLGPRKQVKLLLSINEYPTPDPQRFVTIIKWREARHPEPHYYTINFDINNLDLVKLARKNVRFDLSTSPQQATIQTIPFQRGESSLAWNRLVLEQTPFLDAAIVWSSQNNGIISVRPNLAKCKALNATTAIDLALHFFVGKNENDLVAIRHITIEVINDSDVQIFPTTFYFGEIKNTEAIGKQISVILSRRSQAVRCLDVQSDDPIIKADYSNYNSQVSLSAKIIKIPSVKFLTGYITAEIQDKETRRIVIPYYAIFE